MSEDNANSKNLGALCCGSTKLGFSKEQFLRPVIEIIDCYEPGSNIFYKRI